MIFNPIHVVSGILIADLNLGWANQPHNLNGRFLIWKEKKS